MPDAFKSKKQVNVEEAEGVRGKAVEDYMQEVDRARAGGLVGHREDLALTLSEMGDHKKALSS